MYNMDEIESMEMVLKSMKATKSNVEFFDMMRRAAGLSYIIKGGSRKEQTPENGLAIMRAFLAGKTRTGIAPWPKKAFTPITAKSCSWTCPTVFKFVTRSCVNLRNGQDRRRARLPLFKLDNVQLSPTLLHWYAKSVDNMGGRVEKFRNRFGKKTA